MFVRFNENFIKEDENIFNSSNRALNYGDGFFDSILCIDKIPVLFDQHIERMNKAANVLRLNPKYVGKDYLREEIKKLLIENKLGNARVRVTVFRNDGKLYTPENENASVLITATPIDTLPFSKMVEPKRLCIVNSVKKSFSAFSFFKNCNSLTYVLAGIEIREKGFTDGVILNSNNMVCEALHSNVFFIAGSKLFSPVVETGCIDGVMRKFILENSSLDVEESGAISLEQLLNADEVFVANVVQGIVPVASIEDKTFGTEYTTRLFKNLADIYYKLKQG